MLTDEWQSCSGHSGSAEDAGVAWTALVDQLAATGFADLLPSILFISIPAAFIWLDRRGVLGPGEAGAENRTEAMADLSSPHGSRPDPPAIRTVTYGANQSCGRNVRRPIRLRNTKAASTVALAPYVAHHRRDACRFSRGQRTERQPRRDCGC